MQSQQNAENMHIQTILEADSQVTLQIKPLMEIIMQHRSRKPINVKTLTQTTSNQKEAGNKASIRSDESSLIDADAYIQLPVLLLCVRT